MARSGRRAAGPRPGCWSSASAPGPRSPLSALAVDLDSSLPLPTVAGTALGTTLEAVLAVGLLRRARFRPSLGRLRDVTALVVLAQGHHFDPPQPAGEVDRLLARQVPISPPVGSGHL